jgi:UDP-3-O-[3-hydroxymyristoyl] glucosamine N-acyltransferase
MIVESDPNYLPGEFNIQSGLFFMTPGITINTLISDCNGTIINQPTDLTPDTTLRGISAFDETCPNTVSFSSESSGARLITLLPKLACSALLVKEEIADIHLLKNVTSPLLIAVKDPYRSIIKLIPRLYPPPSRPLGISPLAAIDPSTRIGENVVIAPFCVVGKDVEIGDGTTLHPHVVIYEGARIGRQCTIHAGAVIREHCDIGDQATIQCGAIIGADGFGYYADPQEGLVSIPQIGKVTLEARVDVGANTCIDRATFGTTKVARETKIDNLVQIGHNNKIGSHTIVCGQVGIAGSCTVGNQVVLGGATKIADHLTISDGVRIGGGSFVRTNVTEKGDYVGEGPLPKGQWLRVSAIIRELPKLIRTKKPER